MCVRLCFHQEYGGLDSLSMSDVSDLVEQSRESLDDVWRQTDFEPYPETRMVRLMDVIGGSLLDRRKPKQGNENEYLQMLSVSCSGCQHFYIISRPLLQMKCIC